MVEKKQLWYVCVRAKTKGPGRGIRYRVRGIRESIAAAVRQHHLQCQATVADCFNTLVSGILTYIILIYSGRMCVVLFFFFYHRQMMFTSFTETASAENESSGAPRKKRVPKVYKIAARDGSFVRKQ